ncbi:MAG: hypothetical protein JSV89_05590 [Spirochaetaceae bacterium]|nr:MAG: hypothetical protein JSV89_05590 [Spirochaetaceae bacterium]
MLRKQRVKARGGLKFIEPRFVLWVYTLMRLICPTYLRFVEGISRIGGIAVMNRRNDTESMRTIRRQLSDGPFPVALAPEGQVSYHNHLLGPIEGGTARLAVWCLEDLEHQGRNEEILIVPVACH